MATLTWDVGGATGDSQVTGGTGTWDAFQDIWTEDGGASQSTFANGDSVIFGSGDGTVTVANGIITSGITVEDDNDYVLTGGTLEVNGIIRANPGQFGIPAATLVIQSPLVGNGNITLQGEIQIEDTTNFNGSLTLGSGYIILTSTVVYGNTLTVNTFSFENSGQLLNVELYGNGAFTNYGNTADISVLGGRTIYNEPGAHVNNANATAVYFDDGIDRANFFNLGTIDGNIVGGNTGQRFSNSGTLNGNIDLGGGNDTLFAGGTINGDILLGDGDDSISGLAISSSATSVSLGRGNDTIAGASYTGGTVFAGVGHDSISTNTGSYQDTISGGRGNDSISTFGLEDRLEGGLGADTLVGGTGDDVLVGGRGVDRIDGGDDADRILGGADRDISTGGAGADVFVYRSLSEIPTSGKLEQITDFTQGEDVIQLSRIDADSVTGGNQAFTFVGAAAFSGTAGELRYEQSAAATFVQMDVDGDGNADRMIRLDGVINLTASDFIL